MTIKSFDVKRVLITFKQPNEIPAPITIEHTDTTDKYWLLDDVVVSDAIQPRDEIPEGRHLVDVDPVATLLDELEENNAAIRILLDDDINRSYSLVTNSGSMWADKVNNNNYEGISDEDCIPFKTLRPLLGNLSAIPELNAIMPTYQFNQEHVTPRAKKLIEVSSRAIFLLARNYVILMKLKNSDMFPGSGCDDMEDTIDQITPTQTIENLLHVFTFKSQLELREDDD